MGRLEGKVAVVTGAASGIGHTITRTYIDEGARVIAADINIDGLQQDFGDACLPVRTDVSSHDDVADMIAAGLAHFGRIDVLINNAGISGPIVRTHELTVEGFSRTIGINLMGQFYTIRNVIPHFLENGGGIIINVASISAFPPFTAAADYCASKAAIRRLTESVAYEYARDNIRVNAIAPGHIDTPIYAGIEEHKAKMAERIPVGRFGTPEEVARLAVVMATGDMSYVTGQTVVVDGGRLLT